MWTSLFQMVSKIGSLSSYIRNSYNESLICSWTIAGTPGYVFNETYGEILPVNLGIHKTTTTVLLVYCICAVALVVGRMIFRLVIYISSCSASQCLTKTIQTEMKYSKNVSAAMLTTERFKILLNKSVTEWMENYLPSLGHKRRREFWTSYKALLNTKHEEVGLIRRKEGRLLYAPEQISKEFETTFFRGEHLKKQIFNDATQLQVEAKINQTHDGPEHDIEVFHDEITFDELKNAILKSSNTKSFDIDGLHLTMIKNLRTKALLFLLNIFNACWEYHVWPWTDSRVVFIRNPNKERYDECSSYRPLSISSHIGKTLERILATRIKSYLDVNGLLADEKEGFRSKRNTTRSLYRLHLMLENAKRSRLPTALLNIDLEKAFDSVWVDGLLFKLLEQNISGKMYQIIKSFLKTRVTSIELNGYKSPKFQIDIGVPQGSVLSPSLFIIFLNDFLSNQSQKFKFADDSSLIATGKDPSELSAILRKTCSDIEKWCADWRMLVNGGKTELILFNCEENDFELPCLNGDICQVIKTTKSLGVTIDRKLNYRDHSTKTIERAKQNWNIIKSLCNRKWTLQSQR